MIVLSVAFGDGFNRVLQIGITAHIRRVLAAEFQTNADKPPTGRALDHLTTRHRSGKRDKIDLRRANHRFGIGVIQVQVLKDAIG